MTGFHWRRAVSSAPETASVAQGNVRYWSRAVRASAMISFLLLVVLFLYSYFYSDRGEDDLLMKVLAGAVVLGCYLLVLWGARGTPRRSALGLAQVIGALGFLFASLWTLATLPATLDPETRAGEGFGVTIFCGLFALTQLALMVSASMTLHRMKPAAEQRIRWIKVFAKAGILALIVLLIAAMSIPMLLAARKAANEKSAASALREINECAAAYAKSHPEQGYPASLSAMGPAGGGCLDTQVARGERNGYRFTYTAVDVDPSGRVTTYAANARPISYGTSGNRSFYNDESGKIRFTPDDRGATADEPLLDRP